MGVPKFYRWLSERYPKINQRFGSSPNPETVAQYFDPLPPDLDALEKPDPLSTCGLPPEIDHLYLDMNGIIHGCSHNNSSDQNAGSVDVAGQEEPIYKPNGNKVSGGTYQISNEEIFRNVCYYLDRVIGDMVQPKKLVYMAIDGVAPRAKMNQQRSRRYRSGREGEIETNIYDAHAQAMEEEERLLEREQMKEEAFEQLLYRQTHEQCNSYSFVLDYEEGNRTSSNLENDHSQTRLEMYGSGEVPFIVRNSNSDLREVEPGRFKGKFESRVEESVVDPEAFHSTAITPGTPFFSEFTKHLEHFVKFKLSTDPKWRDLTIIFSGSNVPGEGEHKIMQFIREQRERPDYNTNLRHCIMGQDGDLIMLGLCTHEPNMILLRERVVFSIMQQRLEEARVTSMLDTYIHNAHFEFLHMGVLRDYLAYEFETSNVIKDSPWDLEHTIDDFVFMTFLVGNDFLPHLPAIDIGDNAFDLIFWTYKKCRTKWLKQNMSGDPIKDLPYLTYAGSIVSGRRLEHFLSSVGSHEVAYYDKKKQTAEVEHKRLRKQYKRMRMDGSRLPNEALVASKEASDRAAYREMLQTLSTSAIESRERRGDIVEEKHDVELFQPVLTGKVKFKPVEDDVEESLMSRMGNLLRMSLSSGDADNNGDTKYELTSIDDQDLKGRYYYDKFQFTPFDADKHLALRKAYMEGLVWTLKYYFQGVASWEWYYPYHYGPMLSDLVSLDEILDEISFEDKGSPLNPFEQLLGCMPPSQAHHLPNPYRWLMTDPESPIIDFYPKTFTVDMNGKRWPWEAVVLLPFIDSKRLLTAAALVDQSRLSDSELERNATKTTIVMRHDQAHDAVLPKIGNLRCFHELSSCKAVSVPIEDSEWYYTSNAPAILKPEVKADTHHPLPGFGSLRTGPVQSLWRRRMGLNIFGGKSRYKTASLEMSSLMPPLPPVELLAPKFIGTSIFINYPHYVEALVTAVSNHDVTVRGKNAARKWTQEEQSRWKLQRDGIIRQAEVGEGKTGTGGLILPHDQAVTLSVRPLQGLMATKTGQIVKTYAQFEVEVPLITTFWTPAVSDPRLLNVPSRLEKDAYEIAVQPATTNSSGRQSKTSKGKSDPRRTNLFPARKGSNKEQLRAKKSNMNRHEKVVSFQYSTLQHFADQSHQVSWRADGPFISRLRMGQPLKFEATKVAPSRPLTSHTFPQGWPFFSSSYRQRLPLTTTSTKYLGPKGCLLAAAAVAMSFFVNVAHSVQYLTSSGPITQPSERFISAMLMKYPNKDKKFNNLNNIRGGNFERCVDDGSILPLEGLTPPLEFAHGTTTLAFSFQGGIIVAVDSRASMGSFVGSKTVQKVLPISSHILGTMAGGAADCQFWIRKVKSEALLHEMVEGGKRMSVARVSRILSNYLYNYRALQLSMGTMIAGWDSKGSHIYFVDSTGLRINGDLFAVGSGSTFALGVLDSEIDPDNLSVDQAIALGIKAIRHATFRDAYSGGFINVYLITPRDGWKKVYSEDIARSPRIWKQLQDQSL